MVCRSMPARRCEVQHLDLQVIRQALRWSREGQRVWLCTVLFTYGSAPRAPGSLLAVNQAYVPPTQVLHDHDEIAIIPPVSGG